ncbi:MAG: HAD family hydrolase [Bacteroidetes bacterium]|nr:HAD family hydrolase [Bacteroidota bacterium]
MINHNQIKHIIWDYNGTLLNDAWLSVEIINSMLSARGKPTLTLDQYREVFDFPVKDYYQKVGFDFEEEPFEVTGLEFIILYNERKHECHLHAGAMDVLQSIHQKGFGQSILSARQEDELQDELDYHGISQYFNHISGLEDNYADGKLEHGKRLVEALNIPKDQILFIGDTVHDAEVAEAIGIPCILIPNGHHAVEKLSTCECRMMSGLKGILDIL